MCAIKLVSPNFGIGFSKISKLLAKRGSTLISPTPQEPTISKAKAGIGSLGVNRFKNWPFTLQVCTLQRSSCFAQAFNVLP